MRISLWATLLLVVLISSAFAQSVEKPTASGFSNGNDLERECTSSEPARQLWCQSYIMGIYDGLAAANVTPSCVDGVIGQQVIDITKTYLDKYPQYRQGMAGLVVYNAMMEAYPCPRN